MLPHLSHSLSDSLYSDSAVAQWCTSFMPAILTIFYLWRTGENEHRNRGKTHGDHAPVKVRHRHESVTQLAVCTLQKRPWKQCYIWKQIESHKKAAL